MAVHISKHNSVPKKHNKSICGQIVAYITYRDTQGKALRYTFLLEPLVRLHHFEKPLKALLTVLEFQL